MTDYKTPLQRTFTASINNQPSLVQRSALARASLHPLMDTRLYSTIKKYVSDDFNYDFFLEKKLPMKALKWAMEKGQNYPVTNIVNSPTYKPLIDWNVLAGYCIKYGYLDLYGKILENNRITDWTCIMAQSARLRNWNLIHENEEKKYHLSTVLMYAGESGDRKIVDYFLDKIENPTKDDYAKIVVGAARGGHENIIGTYRRYVSEDTIKIAAEQAISYKNYNLGISLYDFFQDEDALYESLGKSADLNYIDDHFDYKNENTLDIISALLGGAVTTDNIELIIFLLETSHESKELYDYLLENHILSKQTYLIDFFIEKGANNWNLFLSAAIKVQNKNLIDLFVEKGANDWNDALLAAVRVQNKELIDFFIEKGANNWNEALWAAVRVQNKELIEFFIEKGADGWNDALIYSVRAQNKELIDFFIEKGADDWNKALFYAASAQNNELIDFFIEKGADINKVLNYAIKRSKVNIKVVKSLIERGANISDYGTVIGLIKLNDEELTKYVATVDKEHLNKAYFRIFKGPTDLPSREKNRILKLLNEMRKSKVSSIEHAIITNDGKSLYGLLTENDPATYELSELIEKFKYERPNMVEILEKYMSEGFEDDLPDDDDQD